MRTSKNGKLDEFLHILKWLVIGFLTALVLLSVIFLKVHWKGFMTFVSDPAFIDNLQVSRDYQLKK